MHIRSKFVMVGMSMAVFFTGGYIGHSYFTASDIKGNSVSIGQLVDPKPEGGCEFETNAWVHDEREDLYIQLSTSIINQGTVESVNFEQGSGEFSNKPEESEIEGNGINIDFDKKINRENISTKEGGDDWLILELRIRDKNNNLIRVRYKIEITKNKNDKLTAHWTKLGSKTEISEEVPPSEIPPSEEMPPGEETPEVPPSEELPPSEGVPESPETPESTVEPETKPEEEPENKPEEIPQPETPEPSVVEAPSEEPVVE
ncbi:hypothetical protein [Romboutsia sp. 1001216sp1]|uniref:hypothetical protein n=1 Tax=Romboutsia sp. 1001216sp1 TaxID=2986997 RepID=UPI002330E268|nr:hypothetical protein [Romboutsia sp. 1001216sp1]MDB8804731.1 hypothetical protein [Romboutsia sp. 1001216sp1]MDB8806345.1 hypothetical protein [Romboutsia sp. 1001216sp1]MDB8810377.1 hypothetical protein [Romboutsia sp. 1001216sp1]MDB8817535.1 hypothetical protein [Romboutsia sp. 1001216sp1]MDB8818574.1 hypothetical protein [Romboutsia sp. 1001216sp1]